MTTAYPQRTWKHAPGLAAAGGSVRVEIVASRQEIEPVWRQVERELGIDALMASWSWTETWLDSFGDLVPYRFVVGHDRSGPFAVALVIAGVRQRRGPLPVRTLHLGTAGEPVGESVCVEYNRLLVAPDRRDEFIAQLLPLIRTALGSWDILELNGFAPDDADAITARYPAFQVERRVCHVADLGSIREGDGDVVKALGRSVGAKIRKNVRRFEERYGPLTGEWIVDRGRAVPVFDELVALHQTRWTAAGQPGSFASARFLAFHRALIERLLPEGKIVLFRATAGEQVVGTFYGFVERGAIYHYQWGLERFEDNSLSPGFVVGALCMQAALERGYNELNWLAGDVRYKRELATTTRELIWARWERGPWIKTVVALSGARRWARRRMSGEGNRASQGDD